MDDGSVRVTCLTNNGGCTHTHSGRILGYPIWLTRLSSTWNLGSVACQPPKPTPASKATATCTHKTPRVICRCHRRVSVSLSLSLCPARDVWTLCARLLSCLGPTCPAPASLGGSGAGRFYLARRNGLLNEAQQPPTGQPVTRPTFPRTT